jgi:hypothetical protein
MKKLCTILFIVLSLAGKAQYAIAGVHGSIYVDIVPDTTIQSVANGPNQAYFIDINQDGIKDVEIETAYSYMALHSQYFNQEVEVYSQNANTSFFRGGYIDSVTCLSQTGGPTTYTASITPILRVFNLGDTIFDGISYNSGQLQYYNDVSPPIGNHCYEMRSEWTSAGDKYFGVKYKTATNSLYGWIKVNVGYASCKIEEFSIGVPFVGIKKNTAIEKLINIYPNPANNNLQISGGEIGEIKISNVLGYEVFRASHASQVDVSNFQEGIYFVTVKTSEGITTKKIIVQH